MARMLSKKAALSTRVDAFADMDTKLDGSAPTIGVENRAKLESRLCAPDGEAQGREMAPCRARP